MNQITINELRFRLEVQEYEYVKIFNAYHIKDQLKMFGFTWNSDNKCWMKNHVSLLVREKVIDIVNTANQEDSESGRERTFPTLLEA
jgi:hypothetical protein